MSILAQNLRSIRKELQCTQWAMADLLSASTRKAKAGRGKKQPASATRKAPADALAERRLEKLHQGKKNKPSRKKTGRRQKVNSLKMIAQSVNTITVK